LSLSTSPKSELKINKEVEKFEPEKEKDEISIPKMGKTNEILVTYISNKTKMDDFVPSALTKKNSSISVSNRVRNESEPNIMEKVKETSDNIKEYIDYEDENENSIYLGFYFLLYFYFIFLFYYFKKKVISFLSFTVNLNIFWNPILKQIFLSLLLFLALHYIQMILSTILCLTTKIPLRLLYFLR
jgi:hypothetical protein